jgi:hypothetical protein
VFQERLTAQPCEFIGGSSTSAASTNRTPNVIQAPFPSRIPLESHSPHGVGH